ncbi:hypothetical protein FB451DRAFT_639915 [Mycena latifolia]|nr:hypothetical protein FB451DRAFT_639915 [Mycena latifolia]
MNCTAASHSFTPSLTSLSPHLSPCPSSRVSLLHRAFIDNGLRSDTHCDLRPPLCRRHRQRRSSEYYWYVLNPSRPYSLDGLLHHSFARFPLTPPRTLEIARPPCRPTSIVALNAKNTYAGHVPVRPTTRFISDVHHPTLQLPPTRLPPQVVIRRGPASLGSLPCSSDPRLYAILCPRNALPHAASALNYLNLCRSPAPPAPSQLTEASCLARAHQHVSSTRVLTCWATVTARAASPVWARLAFGCTV